MFNSPHFDLLTPGKGKSINIFFAGSGFNYDLLYNLGCRKRLLSWYANTKEEIREYHDAVIDRPSFGILDSGAFSVWNKGGSIDILDYCNIVLTRLKYFDIAANLDVIPGKKGMPANQITKEMTEHAAADGWKNLLHLQRFMIENNKPQYANRIMPIYHQGEDIKWLKMMVDNGFEYIGISPSNDYQTAQRMFWLDTVFNYLRSLFSMPMTHGYAVTSEVLMETYPWMSVDSSSWVQAGGLGQVYTPFGNVCVTDREDMMGKPGAMNGRNWSFEMKNRIISYFKEIGFTLDELMNDYKNRWKANAIYILSYERNYKLKIREQSKDLF